jgi:hypothetical protein
MMQIVVKGIEIAHGDNVEVVKIKNPNPKKHLSIHFYLRIN